MKKIKKVTFFVIIFILCFFQVAYGFSVTDISGTSISNDDALNLGNKLITVCSVIGSVLSVVFLIVIGLKYMTGSIEEKAEYKKNLMPYVIGCILVFAASTIAGIIYSIAP